LPKHLAQLGLEAIPSAATVGGEKALELGRRGARSAKVVSRSFALQELKMEWYVRPKADTSRALQAVLSVLPIDTFVPEPCARTQLERIGAEASRRKVDTDLKFKSSEAQSFKSSGNGFVGGTGWITGYNVQSANPVVVG